MVNSDFSGTATGIAMGSTGPATKYSITRYPETLTAGSSASFWLDVQDVNGDPASDYTGTAKFLSSDAAAVLPPNTAFTAGTPSRNLPLTLKTVGVRTLTATDTVKPALTTTVNITVEAGPPFAVTLNSPAAVLINTAFSPLIAHVVDQYNNVISNTAVSFVTTAGASGADGSVSNGGAATTNATGDASVIVTANGAAGPFTVRATAGSVQSAARTLTILPGPPASLIPAGTPQSAPIGSAFQPFSVTVKDAGGNVLSGKTVTFTAPAAGASGLFPGSLLVTTAVSNASGIATAPTFTANSIVGSYNVVASLNALSANLQLTNTFSASLRRVAAESMSATASAFTFSRATGRFVGTVTLKNNSGVPASGPFVIVFNALSAGVQVYGATGSFAGVPYLQVASPTSLAPGASAAVPVQLLNPANAPISFIPLMYTPVAP